MEKGCLTSGHSVKWEILAFRFMQDHRKGMYCWEWAGKKRKGYGMIHYKSKSYSAHRVSYELFVGRIPSPKSTMICHTCDNPGCVNPAHLYAGTAKSNYEDMIDRERSYGQKQRAKLEKELDEFLFSPED